MSDFLLWASSNDLESRQSKKWSNIWQNSMVAAMLYADPLLVLMDFMACATDELSAQGILNAI